MLALLGVAGVRPTEAQTAACDCAGLLAWTASYLERSYPGFHDKVTPATRAEYDVVHHTARLRNGVLRLSGGGVWVRTWPDNPSGYDRARYGASANRSLAVRQQL
jgi:hypothetical protein